MSHIHWQYGGDVHCYSCCTNPTVCLLGGVWVTPFSIKGRFPQHFPFSHKSLTNLLCSLQDLNLLETSVPLQRQTALLPRRIELNGSALLFQSSSLQVCVQLSEGFRSESLASGWRCFLSELPRRPSMVFIVLFSLSPEKIYCNISPQCGIPPSLGKAS